VLAVASGEVIRSECRGAVHQSVHVETTIKDVPGISFDPVHPSTDPWPSRGPGWGDVLQVKLLDIQHSETQGAG